MKNRILFVDDDELALRGLERLLRSMRSEWDMEFVDSGAKALERMAEASFDVVVSDMRMPKMNGAELLNEVMKRHPKTVRLILSGYADRELILKCVGSTHQYLAKPCEGKALKMTVLRATQLESSLESDTLRKLVTRCDVLPSVPAVYSEIIEALQDLECDTETIGSIIVKDAAMTAKILKLVNSAFFGLGRQIASPSEAVGYLGTDTIKSLILFANTFSQELPVKLDGLSMDSLWSHSLQVANAAKLVASIEGAARDLVDESYVAGLLHDVGKLVLAANLGREYEQALEIARLRNVPLRAAEREVFGADHADIGGYLLGLWGLPVPVIEAIAFHHRPAAAVQKEFAPLTAVHAANWLASAGHPAVPGIPGGELDMGYLAQLGFQGRVGEWRKEWQTATLKPEAGVVSDVAAAVD